MAFLESVSLLWASQRPIGCPFVVGSWVFVALNPTEQWEILRAILIFGLLFVTLAALFALNRATMVLRRRYEARRTKQIQAILSPLGFTLQEALEGLYLRFVGLFKIGQRGHSQRILSHFESPLHADGITRLLDYYFEEGSGKGRRVFRLTLAIVSDRRFALPAFVLAPQRFFSWLAQRFGKHDINFDGFPRFNGTFKLQGDDEVAVRALFTKAVIRELERHPGITLEGHGGYLLLFRFKKRVNPKNFPQFQKEAQQLAQLFLP